MSMARLLRDRGARYHARLWRSVAFSLALSMLTAQRRRTRPTAQIRRLGVFAGISVLAMVHQVREHGEVFF
jgi:hypothetical protein